MNTRNIILIILFSICLVQISFSQFPIPTTEGNPDFSVTEHKTLYDTENYSEYNINVYANELPKTFSIRFEPGDVIRLDPEGYWYSNGEKYHFTGKNHKDSRSIRPDANVMALLLEIREEKTLGVVRFHFSDTWEFVYKFTNHGYISFACNDDLRETKHRKDNSGNVNVKLKKWKSDDYPESQHYWTKNSWGISSKSDFDYTEKKKTKNIPKKKRNVCEKDDADVLCLKYVRTENGYYREKKAKFHVYVPSCKNFISCKVYINTEKNGKIITRSVLTATKSRPIFTSV